MKIIIIGASRGLGAETVRAGLTAGHTVTAFARHPERLAGTDPRLRLVAGDVLRPDDVTAAVRGQDAVLITLGLPTKQAIGFGRSRVLSEGTRHVVDAAQAAGVPRIILETAIGAGGSGRELGPLNRFSLRGVLWWLFREKDRQETLVRGSGLDWVIVRPGALTNGRRGRTYRVEEHTNWRQAGIFTQISRADVADFMLDQLHTEANLGKSVIISYPRSVLDFPRWIIHYR